MKINLVDTKQMLIFVVSIRRDDTTPVSGGILQLTLNFGLFRMFINNEF